jgi:hypothetical protein
VPMHGGEKLSSAEGSWVIHSSVATTVKGGTASERKIHLRSFGSQKVVRARSNLTG